MGRRRSGSDDAAAAVAVAAVAAVGLGLYWVVVGLVRLLRRLTRSSTSAALPPSSAVAWPDPPEPAGPGTGERALVSYGGPLQRGDESAAAEGIKSAFVAWAGQLPGAPKDPSTLVRSVQRSSRKVVLVESTIEGRRLGWRSGPTDDPVAAPSASPLDPWLPADELVRISTTVGECAVCVGNGTVPCATCRGSLVARCAGCDGIGKAYGLASNGSRRLMNCRRCGKKGTVACETCVRGRVECAGCEGKGRVERWCEVESWARVDRRSIGGEDASSANREIIETNGWMVGEVEASGSIERDRVPEAIPAEDRARIADLGHLTDGERVVRQRLVLFEVPVVAIAYGARGHEQTVEFLGRRFLGPPPSVDRVMHGRARRLRVHLAALLAAPLAFWLVYLARGTYFASGEVGGAALALVAAALLAYQGSRRATLGSRGAHAWLALAALAVGAAALLAVQAEPDLADVRRYARSGDLDEAWRELEALGPADDPQLASDYADLRLAEVRRAPSAEAAATWLALLPAATAQRRVARELVDRRWLAEAAGPAKGGDPSAVTAMLSRASPATQRSAEASALVATAHIAAGRRCLAAADHGCAFEHAASAKQIGSPAAADLHTATFSSLHRDADEADRTARSTKELAPRVSLLRRARGELLLLRRYATEAERSRIQLASVEERLAEDERALEHQRAREAVARAREAERERRQAERIARAHAKKEESRRARDQRRRSEQRGSRWPMDAPSGGGCCKHCSTGKPCGDTCIARNKTCRVGRGCAC